jgi:hypothetical protein
MEAIADFWFEVLGSMGINLLEIRGFLLEFDTLLF